ncbi:MAG: MlrC C-terminal domain-containing protein, partial [Nitrospinaceae bacterium]|nr:MlrC C-terminal domain-containing protein [Nitrospinaceae bacterium]
DVKVVISSQRFQNLDQACFRHIGIEPIDQQILVVKSTVHFRADYGPIASRTLVVESPGEHPCRLANLSYRQLRKGVRLEPMGPEHCRD